MFRKKKSFLMVILIFTMVACGSGGGSSSGDGKEDSYQTYGLNFSPYTGPGQDPNRGTIISQSQIKSHLEMILSHTKWIRTFGSSLGMEHAAEIAHNLGLLTAIGAWLDGNNMTNDEEMQNLINAAKAGYVDLAIIGSETLFRGDLTLAELIDYIEWFQQEVPDVPVTTAETYDIWLKNLDLIDHVDVVLANYYSYWEGIHIDEAIAYVHSRHQRVVIKASNKDVIVSETGWPSDGETIGQAVPTPENAAYHFLNFVSWAQAEGVDYFYFEAFDEPWKADYEGPQGAHWGIWTKDGKMKDGMIRVFNGETIDDNWTGECTPVVRECLKLNLPICHPRAALIILKAKYGTLTQISMVSLSIFM